MSRYDYGSRGKIKCNIPFSVRLEAQKNGSRGSRIKFFSDKERKTRFLDVEAASLNIEIYSNYLDTHFSEHLQWPVDNCNLSKSLWLDWQCCTFS